MSYLSRLPIAIYGCIISPSPAHLPPSSRRSEITPSSALFFFFRVQNPWLLRWRIVATTSSSLISILILRTLDCSAFIEPTLTRNHVGKQLPSPLLTPLFPSNHLKYAKASRVKLSAIHSTTPFTTIFTPWRTEFTCDQTKNLNYKQHLHTLQLIPYIPPYTCPQYFRYLHTTVLHHGWVF